MSDDMTQFTPVSRNITVLGDLSLEDGTQLTDTTVTVNVNTLSVWPYTIYVALLYLAGKNARFANAVDFMNFKQIFESKRFELLDFVDEWKSELNRRNDRFYILKFVSASDKPIIGAPPFSTCPRCGKLVWPDTEQKYIDSDAPDLGYEPDEARYRRALEKFQKNPHPLYCLYCGQRFRYTDDDIAYKGVSKADDVVKSLTALSARQPTFAEASTGPEF